MRSINLRSLSGRIISGFIVLIILSSCNDLKEQNEEYFYKTNYTDRTEYSVRIYESIGDTLKVETKYFNSSKTAIASIEDNGMFLVHENTVRLLKKKQGNTNLSEVIFSTDKLDSCWIYFHPFYYELKICYKGLLTHDEYFIFTVEQQGSDGISRVLYLDKNYILIKEISDSPLENFKEMIRINKTEIPYEIMDSIY